MEPSPIYESLERLSNLLRSEEREAGAQEKLQPAQLRVLLYLSRCNRYSDTPAAVTDYLGVTKGTASQTLMTLERRGLLKKRPDAGDGRVSHLRLTEKGRRVIDAGVPSAAFNSALASLPPAQSDAIADSLEDLLRVLLRARGGRSFGVCRTCRHFLSEVDGFRCGLTEEALLPAESQQICREHSDATAGG